MNIHHGLSNPTGIQHRKHTTAKFTGGTCPGCAGLIIRGDEILVDRTFDGVKTTRHNAARCGA